MVQKYQPLSMNFLPPILKRKFIAPGTPREMGAFVMIVGFAVFVVSAWPSVADLVASKGKRSTMGEFVAGVPSVADNQSRLVGVYIFTDENKAPAAVRGERIRPTAAALPKKARVVWSSGRAQKARVVGEYPDYLFGIPIGLAIFGFGMWLRRKRVDPYEKAMETSPDADTEKAQ
jgi:hypothetical protein